MVGTLFMAYHSVQGPRLGIPQMIQSRAQFGMFGAILPIVVVILMEIGFFVSGAVLAGEATARLLHVSTDWAIIIFNLVTMVMAWIGYDFIHRYARWASVLAIVMFAAVTVKMLTMHHPVYHATGDTVGNMILMITIFASWEITWAPYVSDYSRYLPEDTPASRTFWFTYLGAVLGGAWPLMLGALGGVLAASAMSSNIPAYFAGLFPSVQWLILIAILVGLFASDISNLYAPFLAGAAGISPSGKVGAAQWTRLFSVGALAIIGTVIAILASPHFLTNLENFVLFILYLLIPWTAINLTDYYLVRHGHYDIPEVFKINGIYGNVNWWAIGIYVLGFLVELPFINSGLYVGPLVKHLGGADISWIIGAIVSGGVYYVVATRILKLGRVGAIAEQPAQIG